MVSVAPQVHARDGVGWLDSAGEEQEHAPQLLLRVRLVVVATPLSEKEEDGCDRNRLTAVGMRRVGMAARAPAPAGGDSPAGGWSRVDSLKEYARLTEVDGRLRELCRCEYSSMPFRRWLSSAHSRRNRPHCCRGVSASRRRCPVSERPNRMYALTLPLGTTAFVGRSRLERGEGKSMRAISSSSSDPSKSQHEAASPNCESDSGAGSLNSRVRRSSLRPLVLVHPPALVPRGLVCLRWFDAAESTSTWLNSSERGERATSHHATLERESTTGQRGTRVRLVVSVVPAAHWRRLGSPQSAAAASGALATDFCTSSWEGTRPIALTTGGDPTTGMRVRVGCACTAHVGWWVASASAVLKATLLAVSPFVFASCESAICAPNEPPDRHQAHGACFWLEQ